MPLLEFISIKRRCDGMWAIPGSFVRPKGTLPVLAKAFGVTEETKKGSAILRRLENTLMENQQVVFKVRRTGRGGWVGSPHPVADGCMTLCRVPRAACRALPWALVCSRLTDAGAGCLLRRATWTTCATQTTPG